MKSKGCEKLCLESVRVVVREYEEIFESAVAIIESPRHSFAERKIKVQNQLPKGSNLESALSFNREFRHAVTQDVVGIIFEELDDEVLEGWFARQL